MITSEPAGVRRALNRFCRTRSERRPIIAGHLNAYWRPQDYCNNVCLRDCGRVAVVPRCCCSARCAGGLCVPCDSAVPVRVSFGFWKKLVSYESHATHNQFRSSLCKAHIIVNCRAGLNPTRGSTARSSLRTFCCTDIRFAKCNDVSQVQ
jgi:hypothetical protein